MVLAEKWFNKEIKDNIMDSSKLERVLQSIGKGCFIEYFDKFNDPSYSTQDLVELLMHEKKYTESGSRVRVSQSRRIIKENMVKAAMDNIIMSGHTKVEVRLGAKRILGNL